MPAEPRSNLFVEREMTSREACALDWGAPMNGERTVIADDDSGLVARFLRGDRAAFDILFSKHQDYVYHIVYGIVGSAEEARDVTQDVFVQVYRSLPNFRHGSRFATWLYRIAANRAVDRARGARRWRFLPLPETPVARVEYHSSTAEDPQEVFARGLEQDAVQKALMRCPVHHRQILALRYHRDLSLEEIAEILECSLAAAKVRLHRARLVFKENYRVTQELDTRENCEIAAQPTGSVRQTR